ncbi:MULTISPECIES: hypothetical protein [unclassified Sporosarcina]|uniref:hypothetical protein n=1 Tax=unclassified Sporosarcina TaxID=2647733 RepID=UPI00203D8156|nr:MULTISPECIES: hypothetical protein [unclassified Sporosarcina]GKV65915.1 hypothetical protein NCCP2331_20680 [Sporosarcina sp. NCCP-2331]GLB56085.1 hypothetical protein NCCP2378_18720 [Sporosarcina sp. NCCP-2378]
MFDYSDPRSKLGVKGTKVKFLDPVQNIYFDDEQSDFLPKGSKSWWSRGANYFMNFVDAKNGEVLYRAEQQDEYILILFDSDTEVIVTGQDQKKVVGGYHIAIIPSGESKIEISKGGKILLLYTSLNEDLADYPINKDVYAERNQALPSFIPRPESPYGSKIRVYNIDVPPEEGRFGRIFTCSTFMLSFLHPWQGPRDPKTLSPHLHEDFEQTSFLMKGIFVHHFRWPWGIDRLKWRTDQHDLCSSPTVTLIPPGVIHTSEAVGDETNEILDIFCPPRADFAEQEGWVLNEKDYPYKHAEI